MFIVNQYRTEVVNVDNLITIQLDDNVIWGVSNVGKILLGNYEDNASEVFEEMLKVVFPTNAWILKNVADNEKLRLNDNTPLNIVIKGDVEIKRYDIGVWYMPK